MLAVIFLSAAVAVVIFAASNYVYDIWHQASLLKHIPTHTFTDGDNSRQRYLHDLKSLLESGYRKYNVNGTPFKVPIPVGGYSVKYRIILPKAYIEEIKHLSNNVFSWSLASRVIFAGEYTGAPERGAWSGKALRVGIHQSLGTITSNLDDRINEYFQAHLPRAPGEVSTHGLMSFFMPAISQVVNASLVGPELASDPEWLRRTTEFAVDRYTAADEVRRWSPLLARFTARFEPSVKRLRESRVYVREKMRPIYENLARQDLLGADEKKKLRKGSLGYEWLWGGAPDDVTLDDFSDTMMRTIIASIHTSAKTLSIAMIDLLTDPTTLKEVRDEVATAKDHVDVAGNLDSLVKLDCFLKESQRLSPVFLMTMNRILTQDYKFKCSGLTIPRSSIVMAPAAAIATDPSIFDDPNTFHGDRYYRLREESKGGDSAFVMGMSTVDSLGFGLGNQACPGRFMAVNNLKLFLVRLLGGWEISLERNGAVYGGPRPRIEYADFSVVVPSDFNLRLRKI